MPTPGYDHLIYAITTLTRRDRLLMLPEDQVTSGNADSVTPDVTAALVQAVITGFGGDASKGLMLDILESLVARFGAAREEISAAYGVEWKNDILDLVARELRIKKGRIERWANIIAVTGTSGGAEGVLPWKDWLPCRSNEDKEGAVDAGGAVGEWWSEQLDGSLLCDINQDGWLWESHLFEGMNIDERGFVDGSSG